MFAPLKNPNIPNSKVGHAAVSSYSPELILKLKKLGITPIITVPSDKLESRINYHTDLLINIFDKNNIIADKTQRDSFVKYLTIGYRVTENNTDVFSPYPNDSALNFVRLGNNLICCKKATSKQIIEFAEKNSLNIIYVNQGYIRCSVCIINETALITDDESIHNSVTDNGINSLLISKGSVKLNGFNSGFIGGCSGLIDKNKLLFNGDIKLHSDYKQIKEFLDEYQIEAVCIENKPLYDIGSIIPLTELI